MLEDIQIVLSPWGHYVLPVALGVPEHSGAWGLAA